MGAPTTAQELFNDKLPQLIEKNPDKAKELGAIYHFKVNGDGGGEWTVDLASASPSCTQGGPDGKTAQCIITVEHDDFKAMLGNPQLGMQLYFQGKLKVEGPDIMAATKLQKLFSMGGG